MTLGRNICLANESLKLVGGLARVLGLEQLQHIGVRLAAQQFDQCGWMFGVNRPGPFVLAIVADGPRTRAQVLTVEMQTPAIVQMGPEIAVIGSGVFLSKNDPLSHFDATAPVSDSGPSSQLDVTVAGGLESVRLLRAEDSSDVSRYHRIPKQEVMDVEVALGSVSRNGVGLRRLNWHRWFRFVPRRCGPTVCSFRAKGESGWVQPLSCQSCCQEPLWRHLHRGEPHRYEPCKGQSQRSRSQQGTANCREPL